MGVEQPVYVSGWSGNPFAASRAGNQLTLVDDSNAFDFDSDGSVDPATLKIDLRRQ